MFSIKFYTFPQQKIIFDRFFPHHGTKELHKKRVHDDRPDLDPSDKPNFFSSSIISLSQSPYFEHVVGRKESLPPLCRHGRISFIALGNLAGSRNEPSASLANSQRQQIHFTNPCRPKLSSRLGCHECHGSDCRRTVASSRLSFNVVQATANCRVDAQIGWPHGE